MNKQFWLGVWRSKTMWLGHATFIVGNGDAGSDKYGVALGGAPPEIIEVNQVNDSDGPAWDT